MFTLIIDESKSYFSGIGKFMIKFIQGVNYLTGVLQRSFLELLSMDDIASFQNCCKMKLLLPVFKPYFYILSEL